MKKSVYIGVNEISVYEVNIKFEMRHLIVFYKIQLTGHIQVIQIHELVNIHVVQITIQRIM